MVSILYVLGDEHVYYLHNNLSSGQDGCTMNVHMLKHLPACVANWGPLWAYSCFHFESVNGHLKAHYHGTRAMNFQVYNIIII